MKRKSEIIKIFIKENLKWLVVFACIAIALLIIEDVMDEDIMMFDERGYFIVQKYLISDSITPIAKCITNLANAYWLIGFSFFLLIVIKDKKIGIYSAINLVLSASTNFILKQIIQRPRPVGHRLIDEKGYSLPSGHSMVSMAFYGFLIYLIYKNVKNKYLKVFSIILLSILIICIGVSRIYLGVHYTSDVITGFLIAISYLIIFEHIINNIKNEIDKSN